MITQANNIVFSAGLSVGIVNTSSNLVLGNCGSDANVYVITSGNLTGTGSIIAPVVGLYSINGSSGIGTNNSLMQIDAHDIGIEAFAKGSNVYLNDTYSGSTVLQASQAGNIFELDTNGPLTIYAQINQGGVATVGQVTGSIIAIQTNDANGGYGINNDAVIIAKDFIFLTASSTGYIAQPNSGALMYAPNISLVSGSGAIGTDSASNRLLVNSGRVAATTTGLNSFVSIYDEAAISGIAGGQSGSYFTFNTNGNLNIYGDIATGAGTNANGGAINISANGALNIGVNNAAVSLTTNNGPIVVMNNSANAGSIDFAKGDIVYTNTPTTSVPGYVVFNVGAYAQTNTTNPDSNNIMATSSGGASIFYGANGISALSLDNVLNAKGQDIVFNTGSLPASAITLNGNVSITADPPISLISNLSGASVIQNNIANINLASDSLSNATPSSVNNFGVTNVLDNTQSTILINNSNSVNRSNAAEYGYLGDSTENNELVNNTSLVMPIAYSYKVIGAGSGTSFSDKSNENTKFVYGSAIISASKAMEVSLGAKPYTDVKLNLKRGALVLAIVNGNVVSVYDLHDNSANSVVVSSSKTNKVVLTPGQHVTLARVNDATDFAYVNQASKVAYRKINTTVNNGIATYVSDFSIPSAISAVKPLKAMFGSHDAHVKAIANQMLKTIVVVMQNGAGNGAYEYVAKPKLMANSKLVK